MFLKHFDFIFQPFRAINNKIIGIKNIKGNIMVDVNRSKSLAARGKNMAGNVNQFNNKMQNMAGGQPGQADPNQQQQYGQQPQGQQQGGYMQQQQPMGDPQGGQPGAPGGMPPMANPPIRTKGWWIFKKKFCTQCEQQLDKTWDSCPFCVQIAQQAAIPSSQRQAMKTQAFVMDSHGGPGSVQLLGWIVPLQGPQRGELFTLQPTTSIGTDPKSTVVMNDKFMSTKHAEIKAENGIWVLRDAGSTNGTYVNNRRVDRHELVDNDFIKFGSALLKFKSL